MISLAGLAGLPIKFRGGPCEPWTACHCVDVLRADPECGVVVCPYDLISGEPLTDLSQPMLVRARPDGPFVVEVKVIRPVDVEVPWGDE